MKSRIAYIFKFLMPVIFIMYWAGATLFIHKHTIDGVSIVHSHPFSDASHHHSKGDLKWIDMLTHTAFEEAPDVPSVAFVAAYSIILLYAVPQAFAGRKAFTHIRLRAPPALCI